MMRRFVILILALGLALLALGSAQQPAIRIGAIVSSTGPAASLGVPERNTLLLLQDRINQAGGVAGHPVQFVILDDATDPTQAVRNTRRLVQEDNVAAVICCTTTPASMAILAAIAELEVPNISLAAGATIIEPVAERKWIFKTPQTDRQMTTAIVGHMRPAGIRTVAFLGLTDSYGEGGLVEFQRAIQGTGISIVATERFARTDTSFTAQALRVIAARPDAVLIWAIPPSAVLMQQALRERGFGRIVYQSHGVGNPEFLRLGGRFVEGTILPIGPVLVAEQLPDDNPIKAVALEYIRAYEQRFGAGTRSTFGAHAWDAWLILERAIPAALRQASPANTRAFRAALRDAIEGVRELVATHGVFNFSANDHLGLDERSAVMITVRDGNWIVLR